jgi:phage-related minor tail protein/phage-related protein|nr:MAG TPA: tail tape measure protein [Caudoviricetes sp.]
MADKTQNIKTRLSFDGEAQYKAACKEINSTLKVLNSEMKLVTAEYKDNAESADALRAKQDVLQKTFDQQAKKVKETEAALEKCRKATGENSEESKKLETQLNYQKAALVKTEQELKKTADELEKAQKAADELGNEIENSGNQAESAGGKFSGLSGILGGLGGAMSTGIAVVGTAAAAIGTAVVAGLGYTVSQADAAKGAMNDFCAATGTAKEDAEAYRQVMENIYNGNYGEGFEDIAAAMTEIKQQAGDLGADELEKMTTNALTLRDTFDMDVAESTRAATQLMQQFGLTSTEAYNLIAQGAQNGLNQNGDLLDVINEYSNQYSQAGLSAEDMFNSIQNGAETGVWSIDKMGDAFKEFNIRMNDGTANEYLTSLGLNADEVVGKFQAGGDSAAEAMSQISEALQNCDNETLQYQAGVGLMGTMWEDMGADACTSLMNVEGQISKTADAMGQINAVKYDTFGEAMQGAGRILQTSFIMPIGEQALPIFSKFANELQSGAAAAGGDIGKLADSFGTALKNMVGGLADMLPQIATFAVELVQGLADGIVTNAPTIVQAGVDVIKSLVDGLITAIPTLTQSAVEIVTTLIDGIVEMIPSIAEGAVQIIVGLAEGLGQALPELIPCVIDAVLTIVDTLINNVPLLIDAALQLVTGLANGIVAALPVIIEKLPQIITSIINALIAGIPMILTSAGEIVIALVDGIIAAIPLLIEAIPQIIMAIVNGLITGLPQILEAAGQLVLTIITKLAELPNQIALAIADGITRVIEWGTQMQENAGTAITGLLNRVITTLKELPAKIWNTIITCVTKIAEWGVKMQEKAKSAIANVVTSIVNGFTSLPSKMAEIGTNIVQGIWNGINNAKDWILDKIKGFGDAVLDGLKSFFGIASPSKLMRDQVGVFLAQGIGVGFEKEMRNVSRTMQNSIPREFDVDSKVNVHGSSRVQTDGDQQGDTPAGGVVVNQYIYANETSYAKQQKEAAKQMRLVVRTV